MSGQSAAVKYTAERLWPVFEQLLPTTTVLGLLAQVSQRFYQRLYPPLVVLWGFVFQRLRSDHSCDGFVSALASGCWPALYDPRASGPPMSENTAAYCKARQRLPLAVAQAALRQTSQTIRSELGEQGLWCGRPVVLLDGSTVRLTAEAPLVAHYGRPSGQHGASHWPRLRTVAAFDACSGALCEVVEGPYPQSEDRLAIQLLRAAPARLVWVGDQLFGIYHLLQVAVGLQHDAVVRIQASRLGRWQARTWPAGSDRDVVWSPSPDDQCEADLPAASVAGRLLVVRVDQAGFRPFDLYLFTTLTDRRQYPTAAIVQLYARRWQVELNLRHVKTTLAMAQLTGKSVDIIRKELVLGLLAYNLIRGLMGQAARRTNLSPLALSFARCWRRLMASSQGWRNLPAAAADQDAAAGLLERLAACRLPVRRTPRYEPRAVRPKPHQYPYLIGSRQDARQRSRQELANKC